MWSLAARLRPDEGVSVYRMTLALFDANPEAFSFPNVNALKVGVMLRVPSRDEIGPAGIATARAELDRHHATWDDYRRTGRHAVVPAAPLTAANEGVEAPPPVSSSPPPAATAAGVRARTTVASPLVSEPTSPRLPPQPPSPPPVTEEAATAPQARQDRPEPTQDLLWRTLDDRPFSLLRFQLGADGGGNVTFAGSGRFFTTFDADTAVQAQAELEYHGDRRHGQFDVGLVKRIWDAQVGLFSSFTYARLNRFDSGALLVQGAATLDYLFPWGRFGVFGTTGLRDRVLIHQRGSRRNHLEDTMLRVVDQVGVSAQIDLAGEPYVEGNVAYLNTAGDGGRVGGAARLVVPTGDQWAVVAQGGWNETLVDQEVTHGRILVGVQFGRWMRPTLAAAPERLAPVDIPRMRYEVTTRERRNGNDGPVADAGPDQLDVETDCPTSGVCRVAIQLDGSGSFDPDGDELSFRWEPRSGFEDGVTFTTPLDQRQVSFVASEGARYVVRLAVSDGHDVDFDEVTITVASPPAWPRPTILRFDATPPEIPPGGWSMVKWVVIDADRVTIDQGVGVVPLQGTFQADLTTTTTYTLRATNEHGDADERSLTITVIPAH